MRIFITAVVAAWMLVFFVGLACVEYSEFLGFGVSSERIASIGVQIVSAWFLTSFLAVIVLIADSVYRR